MARQGDPQLRHASARAVLTLSCVGAAFPRAAAAPATDDFARLWDFVAVGQASRGVEQGKAPPVRHVCQYGISNATLDIAEYLLAVAQPPISRLTVVDADQERPLAWLRSRHSSRVRFVEQGRSDCSGERCPSPLPPESPLCDLVVYSAASRYFTLERARAVVGEFAAVAWVSDECTQEKGDKASPACNLLNTLWERSKLMLRGYCLSRVCMSRLPSALLKDPNVVPLRCENFASAAGAESPTAEFGQDWYLLWNFFRRGHDDVVAASAVGNASALLPVGGVPRGLYVDVGASLPFDYSNTVVLDRCFAWRGICVEPNPYLAEMLRSYRSCQVVQACVDSEASPKRPFMDRSGQVEFHVDCLPLGEVLRRAGLGPEDRIDMLSIDVEHGELGALQGLPLEEFHVRFIVVEVSRGVRWLEVDTVLLPRGYAKIAVLGRDVVYARLEELLPGARATWPFLAEGRARLPEDWARFHQRVVDEETEEEMRQEREAFYKGLRRR